LRATKGLRRTERIDRALELQPGTAAKARRGLRQLRREALLDRVGLFGLGSASHFKPINEPPLGSGTPGGEKAGNSEFRNRRYTPNVGGDTTTVLVVDDDPALRLLCRVNLELEGYSVVEAGSINEAERALDNGGVDVVLLDLHLGNERGTTLIPTLEERGLGSSVALLTGSPGGGVPDGATVIPKPFAIDDLTGTVRRLAES
jgi:CheY-like chemotaxis protein